MPPPNRQELDPIPSPDDIRPADALAEARPQRRADDPDIAARIESLITDMGGTPGSFHAKLIHDLVSTSLKLIPDKRDTGELKLITAAVKELRYAYRIFGQYPEPHKCTIFGSARTPRDHPDFSATVEFSKLMADAGWMIITGAGGGIMEAGHVGPGKEKSFGVAIRLPFETTANEVIAGDSKLIHFRYFFTRKLMFLSQSEAVALFPGGFGTMDEAFETLTLIQTGKASMIPVVCCEGKNGTYWDEFHEFIKKGLGDRKLISPDDYALYTICRTPEAAADVIKKFYKLYHSSRYVKDDLVIRLKRPIAQKDVDRLSDEFAKLIKVGKMTLRGPFEAEEDHLMLPRLVFTHNRHHFGMIRSLINRINECEGV
jgi:uncharacterized protein (TIGR00730 family)